jgi:IS5 family transposase
VFRVVKCQFRYRKVRYRGIAKNGAQVFALPAGHLRPLDEIADAR